MRAGNSARRITKGADFQTTELNILSEYDTSSESEEDNLKFSKIFQSKKSIQKTSFLKNIQ